MTASYLNLLKHINEEHEAKDEREVNGFTKMVDIKLKDGKKVDTSKYTENWKEASDNEQKILKHRTLYKVFAKVFKEPTQFDQVFTDLNMENAASVLKTEVSLNGGCINLQVCIPAIIYKNDGPAHLERNFHFNTKAIDCLLYTSPSPRDS